MPGEFAKLIVIIYLAAWLNAKRFVLERLDEGLLIVLMIVGFIGGLVYFQPDFSAFVTIVLMGGVMFFLAGANSQTCFDDAGRSRCKWRGSCSP